jgi:glycosyltransferase involved in cell wall biosynthesis
VVADREPDLPGLPVDFRRWRLEDEVDCFSSISVGLMPLGDDAWTRAKCSFKLLQYMALGIPSVASPVGMNADVVRHGENGLLATGNDSWVDGIDALLRDRESADRMARAARATVERDYSLDATAPALINILRSLL